MPPVTFANMRTVPPASSFVDIVLSNTQRRTPTVVHNGWSIQRIRQFYMRKVKFTASNWHERLTQILEDFPKVSRERKRESASRRVAPRPSDRPPERRRRRRTLARPSGFFPLVAR